MRDPFLQNSRVLRIVWHTATLWGMQFYVSGRRHLLEPRTSPLRWPVSCQGPCAPGLRPRLPAEPFLGTLLCGIIADGWSSKGSAGRPQLPRQGGGCALP